MLSVSNGAMSMWCAAQILVTRVEWVRKGGGDGQGLVISVNEPTVWRATTRLTIS